jgi:hypothetical protein
VSEESSRWLSTPTRHPSPRSLQPALSSARAFPSIQFPSLPFPSTPFLSRRPFLSALLSYLMSTNDSLPSS